MGYALKIYEVFREYGEEKARVLAEAFEALEKRYPQILDVATRRNLSETELKLIKEIEGVRLEVEEVRKEIKEIELKFTREVADVKSSTIKWIVGLIGGQTIVLVITIFTLLKIFVE